MTTPNVRCTCTGTCHPETVALWEMWQAVRPDPPDDSPLPSETEIRERYAARILAATDHIGRGTLPSRESVLARLGEHNAARRKGLE